MTKLTELVNQIALEHQAILAPQESVLVHAIKCGELLIEAQALVPNGGWGEWLDNNLDIHRNTAYGYMRLARHQDIVLASGVTGIDPALAYLSEGRTLNDTDRQEMRKLKQEGTSINEIADMYGVRKSTVSYWTSSKNRDRIKSVQRRERERRRKRELKRAEAKLLMREVDKSPLTAAYSDVRRAAQNLDRAYEQIHQSRQRAKILEAIDAVYKAEDAIVEVMRRRT